MVDDEGGASDDVVRGDIGSRRGGRDEDVRDTLERLGDHGHVVGIELNGSGSDTVVEDGVLDGITLSRVVESEGGGLADNTVLDSQGSKGLDGESGVGLGARGDESRSDGVDHVEAEGGVVSGRPWLVHLNGGRLPCLVSGLGGEDGGGDGEVSAVRDVLSGTGVGRDTDVLDQGSERDE